MVIRNLYAEQITGPFFRRVALRMITGGMTLDNH